MISAPTMYNRPKLPSKSDAVKIIRALGNGLCAHITEDKEVRVSMGSETSAYYTDNALDAIRTAQRMIQLPQQIKEQAEEQAEEQEQAIGSYTMTPTLSRSKGLVDICDRMNINLKGVRVLLSNPQRFALIEDFEGFATVLDDSDWSVHFFETHEQAGEFIRQS